MRHWPSKRMSSSTCFEARSSWSPTAGRQTQARNGGRISRGRADGHQLVNKTKKPVLYLEIGDRTPGRAPTRRDMAARMAEGKWFLYAKGRSPLQVSESSSKNGA